MSESRRIVMTHAMELVVGLRDEDPGALFADDVSAWSPNLTASNLDQFRAALADRSDAISNAMLTITAITAIDVIGDKAIAEWILEAEHTAPLSIDGDMVAATGRRLRLGGVTIADFRGHKIRSFRTYFDPVALLEQMVA